MAIQKGKQFEKDCAALAGKRGKRVPRSGAIGTVEGIPRLAGDFRWDLPWLKKMVIGEAKHGYGGSKSISVKKEWFSKIYDQGKNLGFYPVLALKFKFSVHNGMTSCVCIPTDIMETMINDMENIWLELCELRNEQEKQRKRKS